LISYQALGGPADRRDRGGLLRRGLDDLRRRRLGQTRKKLIEDGEFGGKGSEAHAAAVTGDNRRRPLQGPPPGPAINPMIKGREHRRAVDYSVHYLKQGSRVLGCRVSEKKARHPTPLHLTTRPE